MLLGSVLANTIISGTCCSVSAHLSIVRTFLNITARIRRTAKVMFSQVCVCSTLGEVYPSPRFFPRCLVQNPFHGCSPVQALGGTPVPGGRCPSPGQGVPQSWLGILQSQAGGTPVSARCYTSPGVPPAKTGLGYPPPR